MSRPGILLVCCLLSACAANPDPPPPSVAGAPDRLHGVQSCRLRIDPTWGHPVVFRVTLTPAGGTLECRWEPARGMTRHSPPPPSVSIRLTPAEAAEFGTLVAASGCERMGGHDPGAGLDGESWSLTTSRHGRRHTATRWCPNHDPKRRGTAAFAEVFRWCAEKAGVTAAVTNRGHCIFDRG